MNWKLVNFCEFDKYAIKSYCAIHNVDESFNLGDITKVNEKEIADFDLMTWGFPCQDISVAGKQTGFIDEDGEKTRSGMYYEGMRILQEKKPKISIIENVKNLTSKKFKNEFETLLNDLTECSYNSYWKVLNAKNYGVPQNRERVFIVSIRKDIDNYKFKFPKEFDNGIRLKDLLEDGVDEKYYINTERTRSLINQLIEKGQLKGERECADSTINDPNIREISNCITARYDAGIQNQKQIGLVVAVPKVNQIGNIVNTGNWKNPQRGRIYSPNGCSPSLNTVGGGGLEPKILIDNKSKSLLYSEDITVKHTELPCFYDDRDKGYGIKTSDICPTQRAERYGIKCIQPDYRIRKLTPKECWRVMGFEDRDIEKAQEVKISNAQLYKQAGNSIVVDVPYYIFKQLYKAIPEVFEDLKVSSFFSGIGAFEKALDKLQEEVN